MVRVNYVIQQVKNKLNKLDSSDYDNIPHNKILLIYNESRLGWLRRNLTGTNMQKAGDEGSKRRLSDFNVILKLPVPLQIVKKDGYYLTSKLPDDYFEYKRLVLKASSSCCRGELPMTAYLTGESDVDMYLRSSDKCPSFEWGETFCTLIDNRLKIYTDNKFDIASAELIHYRFPHTVKKKGVYDLESGLIPTADVNCEFKKDLVDLFILETVKVISGNIESFNTNQISEAQVETNN